MKSKFELIVGTALLVAFSLIQSAAGAGVTIITHGWENGAPAPDWVYTMANAISNRAAIVSGNATVYRMSLVWQIASVSVNSFEKVAGPDPATTSSAEIIVIVDWSSIASAFFISTRAIAQAVVPKLMDPGAAPGLSTALVELPIHLVGHSRGASVNAEVARLLAQNGIWVDQTTTLDPHPVDGVNQSWNFEDAPVLTYENIIFADNYWRADGFQKSDPFDVDGRSVFGAYNVFLNGIVTNTTYLGENITEHTLVHAYYYGTINMSAINDQDDPPAPILDTWYSATAPRNQTGFYWSRIAGGNRLIHSTGLPWWYQGAATCNRYPVSTNGQQWPNVMLENVDKRTNHVVGGTAVRVHYVHNDADSSYTVSFFTDDDVNPYNTPPANNSVYTDPQLQTARGVRAVTQVLSWSPDLGQNNRYLYAKVSDGLGHTRYYYLPQRFSVTSTPPTDPPLPIVGSDLTPSPTLSWNDPPSGGDGDHVPEAGERVQLKVKLSNNTGSDLRQVQAVLSCDLGSVQIVYPTVVYGDLSAGHSSWSGSWFDVQFNFATTTVVPFKLRMTYTKNDVDYYQDWTCSATIYQNGVIKPQFAVDHIVWRDNTGNGNGNGIMESGEEAAGLDLYLKNVGNADAQNVKVELRNVQALPLSPANPWDPTLTAGGSAQKVETFAMDPEIPRTFAGIATADIAVTYTGSDGEQVIYGYPLFDVRPDKWITVTPSLYTFGVSPSGTNVTVQVRINNEGSTNLQVTAITPNSTDTSWTGASLPWVIAPGDSKTIQVTIDTTGLQGDINRQLVVTSDGRNKASFKQMTITGLVSDAPPAYEIPNTAAASNPDVCGNIVVWQDSRNGNADIYGFNLLTGREFAICTNSASQTKPRVAGNIVAWNDTRNGNTDVYGFNLTNGQEFVISTNSAEELLVGVDTNRVAFMRTFATLPNDLIARNMLIYDTTVGQTEDVTSFAVNGNNPVSAIAGNRFDYGSGTLVWNQNNYTFNGSTWDSASAGMLVRRIGVDNSPIQVLSAGFSSGPSANEGKVVWTKDSTGNNQVYLWGNQTTTQLTSVGEHAFNDNLAIGSGLAVYDKLGATGLFYWDITNNVEKRASETPATANSARMDGNSLVWQNGSRLLITIFNQLDLLVATNDISFSKDSPTQNEAVDVTVTVHNINKIGTTNDLTVSLYDGDPDAGGVPLSTGRTISGGFAGLGSASVTFTAVTLSTAGSHNIYARVSPVGSENPANNKAFRTLMVGADVPTVTFFIVDPFGFETGSKPAVVLVNRAGNTNTALTVNFTIGGNASNGVDYATLSNSVIIPAGAFFTPILVTPIDDALAESTESVILTLSSNAAYSIGSPSGANVFIADNDSAPQQPSFQSTTRLQDGSFQFNLLMDRGRIYVVDVSTNLTNWTPIFTNTSPDIVFSVIDLGATNAPFRFYRIRNP